MLEKLPLSGGQPTLIPLVFKCIVYPGRKQHVANRGTSELARENASISSAAIAAAQRNGKLHIGRRVLDSHE